MFDYDDLKDKADWLETLAQYIEWDYAISYQRSIDEVLALLREMMKREEV